MLARVLGALVLGVGLATAASAQQYDPNVRLPEIRVTPRPEPETLPPSSTPSRVDTLTGPELTRDRPSVLADAVNMVTRRGKEVREIVPEVAVGSFGRRDYRLRWGGAARPLDYALSLTESLEDGYRDFADSRVSRVFGKLGLATGGTDATLSYQWSQDKIRQAGSLPESDARRHPRRNFTAGDFFEPELHQVIWNGEQQVGGHLTLAGNAFVRALDTQQFNVNLPPPNSRLLNRTLSTGGAVQASHDGAFVGRKNVLVVGAEYVRHDVRSRTFEESSEGRQRSEEHTSELQSQSNLVCRLLLEKKKKEHPTKTFQFRGRR